MSRPSEPWASREAGRHTDVAWGGTVMRDYGWPDQVFTTTACRHVIADGMVA